MNKQPKNLFLILLVISCSFVINGRIPAQAQYRGQDSQDFFERGNEIIEQEIREIRRENKEEQTEQKSPELKTELDEQNSSEATTEEEKNKVDDCSQDEDQSAVE